MIGIIGGTFDPIHFGHLRPALEIAEQFDLDEVRFIPSANPPHRWKPIASAEHRLNMVKLAVEGFPLFTVDDREYHRQGSSYTVDTLQSIVNEEDIDKEQADEESATPSLLMMLGLDAFQSFTQWRDWQKILELTHIVVSTRPGYSLENADKWMQGRVVSSI
ncbi:MAG TPA: nicotinate (nicotinamide) nucleotide adenylyltransferase, partial [Leucothrix mucor]|nr:nicotinate (nicotinamide) nucleotide adenylyltransferase [Leucothrix mucor]